MRLGLGLGPTLPRSAGGSPAPMPLDPALTQWRVGGTRGKTVLFLGDSTTAAAPPSPPNGDITNLLNTLYSASEQQMDGVQYINGGESGVTFANVMNGSSIYNINWALTQNFDCLVVKLGINDVRNGSTSAAQISTLLTNLVNQVHAAKPNACIVLATPNSFLSSDPTGSGYITPNISFAQQYTDALWNGYNNVKGNWPTFVAHLDLQTLYYGRTCQPLSSLMYDVIHPNASTGYPGEVLYYANLLIPRGWPFVGPQPATDPFWNNVVLLLNGDALTDAKGRHTLTQAAGTVTASGGWLNFDGVSGLKILDNLADFAFGLSNGTQDTALCTVEVQVNSPVHSQANGQRLVNNTQWDLSNTASPDCNFFVSGGGLFANNGGNVADGADHSFAFCYSHQMYSTYKDGVRTQNAYVNFDSTTVGTLWLGVQSDLWNAVFLQGKLRVRITRENRFNHDANYTPITGSWPTS